jgi:hypothetical protein
MRLSRKFTGVAVATAMAAGTLMAAAAPVGAGGEPVYGYDCVGADPDSQELVDFLTADGTNPGTIPIVVGVDSEVPDELQPGDGDGVNFFWRLLLADATIAAAREFGITSIGLSDLNLTVDIAGSVGPDSQVVGTPADILLDIENDPVTFPTVGPFSGSVQAGEETDIAYLLGTVKLTVFIPAFQISFGLDCAPATECLLDRTFVTGVPPEVDCPIPFTPPPTTPTTDPGATVTTAPGAPGAGAAGVTRPRFTG